MLTSLIALTVLTPLQDSPVAIPANELPKKAPCVVCEAGGSGHGEEKPAAGLRYKGKEYFFCNKNEPAVFKKDPEAFMAPVLPRPMPKFDLADTSGKAWNADSFKDKVVLVDFWATWCAPCKEMKPILDKVRTELAPNGFEVLSVSIDEKKATLDKYLPKAKFINPVLWDSNATFAAWNVRAVPAFFVVRNGEVVAQWVGKKKLDEVRAAIKPWLKS